MYIIECYEETNKKEYKKQNKKVKRREPEKPRKSEITINLFKRSKKQAQNISVITTYISGLKATV